MQKYIEFKELLPTPLEIHLTQQDVPLHKRASENLRNTLTSIEINICAPDNEYEWIDFRSINLKYYFGLERAPFCEFYDDFEETIDSIDISVTYRDKKKVSTHNYFMDFEKLNELLKYLFPKVGDFPNTFKGLFQCMNNIHTDKNDIEIELHENNPLTGLYSYNILFEFSNENENFKDTLTIISDHFPQKINWLFYLLFSAGRGGEYLYKDFLIKHISIDDYIDIFLGGNDQYAW